MIVDLERTIVADDNNWLNTKILHLARPTHPNFVTLELEAAPITHPELLLITCISHFLNRKVAPCSFLRLVCIFSFDFPIQKNE